MLAYRLFLSFLFINKYLPVNKLAQITPKIQTSSCSSTSWIFCNGFLTGLPACLDIYVPGDCKLFVWKSVNCICRKKNVSAGWVVIRDRII